MYLIKYALTGGVEKVKVKESNDDFLPGLIEVVSHMRYFRLGRDIVETKQEAFQAAYDMREKKIKSLKKQLEKYENFDIVIPD